MNMDRDVFGKKSAKNQQPRTDRFIPQRSSIGEQKQRCSLHRISHENEIQQDNWLIKHQQQTRYKSHLSEAFELDPPPACRSNDHTERYLNAGIESVQPWPCRPRKKSCLMSPVSVLDLPSYQYAIFPDILDWSSDDILVAALGLNYYMWSWRSQELVSKGRTCNRVQCCKFDPRGELLALGTEFKSVEIHNITMTKNLSLNFCACLSMLCSTTAVDWSPTGNSFVTGCSRGTLNVYDRRRGERVCCRRICRTAIMSLRVSPNARFLACSALAATYVLVFSWPSLAPHTNVESDCIVKSITWHPWRSALLAVGAVTPEKHTRIGLWDAPPGKIRQATVSPTPLNLDAMLFSHRTGELVLSMWNSHTTSATENGARLVVLSDPDTVVDQWGDGRKYVDRVRTMVFSPTGTKLATATTDEDLIIWNFLPDDEKKKEKTFPSFLAQSGEKANTKVNFSALPVYFDETAHGVSLR